MIHLVGVTRTAKLDSATWVIMVTRSVSEATRCGRFPRFRFGLHVQPLAANVALS